MAATAQEAQREVEEEEDGNPGGPMPVEKLEVGLPDINL